MQSDTINAVDLQPKGLNKILNGFWDMAATGIPCKQGNVISPLELWPNENCSYIQWHIYEYLEKREIPPHGLHVLLF